MKKPSREVLHEIIIKSYGNLTTVSKSFDASRTTVMKWIDDYELRDVVQQGRDHLLDVAEDMLAKKIKDGDTATLIFFLKTQGKKRGYIERQELTGAEEKPLFDGLNVKIVK